MTRNNRVLLTARLMLLAVCAFGLAAAGQTARAQGEPDNPAAASKPTAPAAKPSIWASPPSSVDGVTVNAQRRRPDIPAEKAAAYEVEAAKAEAWRKYRRSMPPLTNDPNDDSKDFPGIQIHP